MSETTSKSARGISFPELQRLKTSDQVCPRHGVNMVYMQGHQPFCMVCTKEKIEQQNHKIIDHANDYWHKRRTSDVLAMDSIFDDPTLMDANFDNFHPNSSESANNLKLARKIAGEYLNPKTTYNTILTGLPGRGKSHLALSIAKAVNDHADKSMACLFVSVNELFRLIKGSFDHPDSRYNEQNMVQLLSDADLLVLDDLGSEATFQSHQSKNRKEASDYVQNVLFGIVNNRQRTIITTNLGSADLASVYNPKIISRIYRGINGHVISFTAATPDKREVSF